MKSLIRSSALLLCLASVCLADGFTGEPEQPPIEPFVGEKTELFRFSRDLKSPRQLASKYVAQQQHQQLVENDQVSRQQVGQNEQQQQQVAAELPAFSSGTTAKTGEVVQTSQAAENVDGDQQQKTSVVASSSSSKKSGPLSKTITTTTTTTTTTQNNQDQPQVAQIKEIRVHTVPLSEAVHYANYMVVPTSSAGSRAARLEESSSSSSSSHKSSSSSTSETEQVAVAPAPTVVVNPPPVAVSPDCVLQRLIVERPVSSQLVVNVAPEVKVSHSSSSSHSSKIVSENAVAAPPESTVYSVRRVFYPPAVYSARVVQVPPVQVPGPALKEEHYRSESRSSREESHGLGHSVSSSSSSSSSRTSKSSTTTTSQTAALIAPPPPPPAVRTVTTIVRQAAPLIAVKAAPLVEVSSGQTSDVSVDHRQSGPNYNYGYSIKQHSSEPGTKGVVVGDRVVYLK